ncbi:hypothetical protein RDI58_003684 [Solanum bulbocastanum]|uniref:Uncharacterized protein n=1 Tax=Solanum bulbocastanum TaxID=147425 RepID=A0AAN8U8T1_SOLBU
MVGANMQEEFQGYYFQCFYNQPVLRKQMRSRVDGNSHKWIDAGNRERQQEIIVLRLFMMWQLMPETIAVSRLHHSAEAICWELPQQSSHQCDQSSTPSCGDGFFCDERICTKKNSKFLRFWDKMEDFQRLQTVLEQRILIISILYSVSLLASCILLAIHWFLIPLIKLLGGCQSFPTG